jgi:deazaflavin-dependent oxidoreductase (nitroreductase family)
MRGERAHWPTAAVLLPRAPALPHPWLHRVASRYIIPWVVRLGLAGGRWSPIGLVLNVGRRSGHRYTTPLAVHRPREQCFVPLTDGPNARWCLNVVAADGCRVRLRDRESEAIHPRVVDMASAPSVGNSRDCRERTSPTHPDAVWFL